MDRGINRGLDLFKAKLTRLRQLFAGKNTKQDIKRILPQEVRNLTPAQILILADALEKNKRTNRQDGEWAEYDDYSDCHGDYYDAE